MGNLYKTINILSLVIFTSSSLFAQVNIKTPEQVILEKDARFWTAYNTCDIAVMGQFLSADLEFYHDKGGLTEGAEQLLKVTRENLCGNSPTRLRREAVAGTVKVYPLQRGNETYGAVISGEHVFYIVESGKQDRLDGRAKFTHVWLLKDGEWKMSRILSYDHGPARP